MAAIIKEPQGMGRGKSDVCQKAFPLCLHYLEAGSSNIAATAAATRCVSCLLMPLVVLYISDMRARDVRREPSAA